MVLQSADPVENINSAENIKIFGSAVLLAEGGRRDVSTEENINAVGAEENINAALKNLEGNDSDESATGLLFETIKLYQDKRSVIILKAKGKSSLGNLSVQQYMLKFVYNMMYPLLL